MQKVIEVQGFTFSFKFSGLETRDKSFEFESFNYGGGSFYQRFKSKVPAELHAVLKSIKNVDMYIMDNKGDTFSFVALIKDEQKVHELINQVLLICKTVHQYTQPVEVSIKKRVLIEETSDVIVV